jgi:hypothetical protein
MSDPYSYSGAEEGEQDAESPANTMPDSPDDRDLSSFQIPNFGPAPDSDPVNESAHSADETRANASSNGGALSGAPLTPSTQPNTYQQQRTGNLSPNRGDSLAQPGVPALRRRQPPKQIGQIPMLDDSWITEPIGGPGILTAAQLQQQHDDWMRTVQQYQDQQDRITQINQSSPYISNSDGRWKKRTADPATGVINENDILDSGSGKIDPMTGDIYVPTVQGPQFIGVDPQQKRLSEIVGQKALARMQGSPSDANIAAAQSQLLDIQRQLQGFQGIPDRLSQEIAKYSNASQDPSNTAAAYLLQNAQAAFTNWKQQNPNYSALTARRNALASQIQSQTDAKAQRDLQVAQLLTSPYYVQWNGATPPSGDAGGQDPSAPGGAASTSDISIHELDARAGELGAQTGFPAGLAYVSALSEAKQKGAQTVDGSPIDDAIQGVQSVANSQLMKMPPQQLRQAFPAGLITRQQAKGTALAQHAAQDQLAGTTDTAANTASTATDANQSGDPVAQSVTDLTARAADLRNKIQSAFDTGGADGARDLATYRAAVADTESLLQTASQTLLNRVPAAMQQRIAQGVAPKLDWAALTQSRDDGTQDPMTYFAHENLGSALRDQVIPSDVQQKIRQLAINRGVNPDLADHIANQAVGADAVRDLITVLRGGSIDQGKAEILQDMGLLQQSDPNDPTSPLHLTEDAQLLLPPGGQRRIQLNPGVIRYSSSPDPAHGSALYQNAVAGMQHFSDTAERALAAQPSGSGANTDTSRPDAATQPYAQPPLSPNPAPDPAGPNRGDSQQESATSPDSSPGATPANGTVAQPNAAAENATPDANENLKLPAAKAGPATANPGPEDGPSEQQNSAPHPALANTPQQALQDAANGKKAYLYDPKNGIQFKPDSLADGLKQAVQDGVVDKDWAAQHQQEFQDAQDKYRALVKAAGSAQVLKALIHGAGPGAAFALAFPVGATGGAALGTPIGAWAGGILGAPTGPGEVAAIPVGGAIGAGIGYMLGGLAAGTLAAFAARKGLQALGQYSDAIKSLNASAELHPIADATGELATLAFNPVGAAEKAAGKGFSYALGAPAAVKSITNLTNLGAQAAKGAAEIGASGALAATKAVGGQLVKAAAAGLIIEGVARPAVEGAVWVAANTLGIHTDAPQPPTVTSLLQSAALSVLLAGHGIEFKDIPAGQVTSAMVRGKVRQDLGIPLDSADPQHIAQVTSYLQSKGVPIDASNAQALSAPLSASEQHLYTDLSAKVDAMRAAGKFDGTAGDFVPVTQATVPGASGKGAVTLAGGVAAVDKPSGGGSDSPTSLALDSSARPALPAPQAATAANTIQPALTQGTDADSGHNDGVPAQDITSPALAAEPPDGTDVAEQASQPDSVDAPTDSRKRMNVGSSGHHVPAVRKAEGRVFEIGRGNKSRPTFHPLSDDPGYDHWKLHHAERPFVGPRKGPFEGSDDELFDAYRKAYQGLGDIRVDVRSPDEKTQLGSDVSPVEGVDLIENWLRQQGLR